MWCDRTMPWKHAANRKEFGKTKKCWKRNAHDLYVASPTYLENIRQNKQIGIGIINSRGRRQDCKSFKELTEDTSGAFQMWPSGGKVWIDPLSWHRHEPQGIEQWNHKTRNESNDKYEISTECWTKFQKAKRCKKQTNKNEMPICQNAHGCVDGSIDQCWYEEQCRWTDRTSRNFTQTWQSLSPKSLPWNDWRRNASPTFSSFEPGKKCLRS